MHSMHALIPQSLPLYPCLLQFQTALLCQCASLPQVMGSKRIQHIEKEIQRERTAGRATYFGESMELIGELQLQQL